MEDKIILKITFLNNLVIAKYNIGINLVTLIFHFTILGWTRILGLLVMLITINITFMGFIAIAIHRQYFLHEKNKKIILSGKTISMFFNDKVIKSIKIEEILKIVLVDSLSNGPNSVPSLIDSYYYIIIYINDGTYFQVSRVIEPC